MSFTLKTTFTKPADKSWWYDIDLPAHTRYANFVASFPGVVSAINGAQDANTNNSTVVFESKERFDAFVTACQTNSDWLARKSYMEVNGITASFTHL